MEKLICSQDEFAGIIEETVNSGGSMPLVVTGNSMRPFMKDGRDTVWLEACRNSDIRRGKILLFRRKNGKFVLHRVRKVLSGGIIVMNGDAQHWCEEINKEQVIAVVTHIEKDGRKQSCQSLTYRIRSEIWQLLMPFRYYIFRIYRIIKKRISRSE